MRAEAGGLVQAVVDGRAEAPTRLDDALAAAPDADGRAVLLDPLAVAAADSSRALEALLTAVHGQHLAMPAIHRLVVDRHDAEDVEQDVLIKVARSISSYRGDARFTTWLHTLARNTAVDLLRRRKEALSLDQAGPLTAAQRVSSIIATRHTVRQAVDGLAPEYREPVVLRDLEHRSYQEIADRLGLNLNTTKSRVFRGRALLAAALDPNDPLDDADSADSADSAGGEGGEGGEGG